MSSFQPTTKLINFVNIVSGSTRRILTRPNERLINNVAYSFLTKTFVSMYKWRLFWKRDH